jgi:glucuronate isomerase
MTPVTIPGQWTGPYVHSEQCAATSDPMAKALHLHEDRLFPADAATRGIAQRLYREVADLPIISPHGHTDPQWFAGNEPFTNATELLLAPDHYLYRMLYSQGVDLEASARATVLLRPIRAPRGACSRSGFICFAAHPRRCG